MIKGADGFGSIAPSSRLDQQVGRRRRRPMVMLLSVIFLFSACGGTRVSSGAFRNIEALEARLERQISTKGDVEKLLGSPDGRGSAALPLAPEPREVWFYQDIEGTDVTAKPGGIIEMKLRQQILLVFFYGGFFDGFMWYSTAMPALGKTQSAP